MTSLAVEEWGDGPCSRPLVLLHGALGTRADWAFIKDNTSCRTLAIDLPAHGDSSKTFEGKLWSYELWHRALWDALSALNVERPILAGYSMGGRLALTAAATAPERVGGLLLFAAGLPLADESERARRQVRDQAWAQDVRRANAIPSRRELLERWWAQPVFGQLRHQPTYAALLDERARRPLHRSADVLEALGTGRMPGVDLQALFGVPLHYVAGALDDKYAALAERFSNAVSGWTAEVIPDCGHALLTEAPGHVGSILLRESKRMAGVDQSEEAA